jgi:hypothetical protein
VPGGSRSLGRRRLVGCRGKGIASRFQPGFQVFLLYSTFPRSDSTSITFGADVEHVPWRPNTVLFTPIRGGGRGMASTSGSAVMTAFPAPSSTRVTVVIPPPPGPGRGGGDHDPRVPRRRRALFTHVIQVRGGRRSCVGVRGRGH